MLALLVVLVLVLYIPPVQNLIANKAEQLLAKKLQTEVHIGAINLNLLGNLVVKDVYIKDPHDEKVFEVEVINTEIDVIPLIQKKIHLDHINVSGLQSSLIIDPGRNISNIDFIISAFSSEPTENKSGSGEWDFFVAEIGLERSFFSLNMPGRMEFSIDLGSISLNSKATDLDNLDFDVRSITIGDTDVILKMWGDTLSNNQKVPTTQTKSNQNGNVSAKVNRMEISNSSFVLELEEALHLVASIGAFEGKTIDFNLLDQLFRAEGLELQDSRTRIDYPGMAQDDTRNQEASDTIPANNSAPKDIFINNFNWNIESNRTRLVDCEFDLFQTSKDDQEAKVFPDNILLKKINISLDNMVLARQKMAVKIKKFEFFMDEGIGLKGINGALDYQNNQVVFKDLAIETLSSQLNIDAVLSLDTARKLGDYPAPAEFNIVDLQLELDRKDLDLFLDDNILKEAEIQHLSLKGKMEGSLDDFQIGEFQLALDEDIILDLSGGIRNPLMPDKRCFGDLKASLDLNTNLVYDVIDSLNRDDLNLPEKIQVSAEVNGCPNDLNGEIHLKTNQEENIQIMARYRDLGITEADTLSLVLIVDGLDLGNLLQNDKAGKIYFNSETRMSGVEKKLNHLEMIGRIDSLELNQYLASGILLTASYVRDSIRMNIESADSILNFAFETRGLYIDSIATLTSKLSLNELDLRQLGISEEPVKIQGKLSSEKKLGKDTVEVAIEVSELSIVTDNTYEFDSIRAMLHKYPDTISFAIKSNFISGRINSTIAPDQLKDHLIDFYRHHFVVKDTLRFSDQEGSLSFNFTSDQSWESLALMIPGLDDLRFSKIEGKINELQNTSFVTVSIPKITYRDVCFDSLYFNITSNPMELGYNLQIPKISYDNYTVNNFNVLGKTDKGIVNNVLFLQDSIGDTLIRVGFLFQNVEKNEMEFRINQDSLILNSKLWSVNEDNTVSLGREGKVYGNIQIDDGQESLHLFASDTLFQVNITDFQLSNLSSLLENLDPDVSISGELNISSDVRFRDEGLLVNSNILLRDFIFQDTHFGNITMEFFNNRENSINGNVLLENGKNTLRLEGNYAMNQSSNPLKAELNINFDETEDFKSFGKAFIRNPKGRIQGNVFLTGDTDHVNANGKIDFNSFDFLLVPVNNTYSIADESISLNENTLIFNNFILQDSIQNNFSINGSIKTEKINVFSMDLSLKADRFSVYNGSVENNPNFYGSLIVSMDAILKGTTANPNIWLDLTIDKGTDLVYALPPKNFDLVDSEGIVEFVNFSAPDTTQEIGLEQYVGDTIFSKLNWIDLNAVVRIDRSSQFMIDIDPISGDYIQFGGSGNLNLLVQKNQNPRITGTYEFDRGIYEVSFYGLVKKTFEFEPGSIITWSGDPYAAQLRLKATNTIRTASAGLVSREIYGLPDEEKSKYRRSLPYTVEINIAGQVEKPEIKFRIDLPQEERNGFPLVDSKLNQLAEPEHESELTRQVFGLLTIGSFIPETTGPGGGGDYGSALASTAAINSLNSLLTNELNKLSGKYITFADLDIGMQSFSEMGGGTQSSRTSMDVKLSKKLFDDRITIEAQSSFDLYNDANKYNHSSEQSTVHSDFAIIYDLTENGDYKLKAFERSAYDIIYKDTRMGGVAVIFIKEFDKYKKERKSKK